MENELKPCPFCGSATAPAERNAYKSPDYQIVVCAASNGGCGASSGWHETEAEAIAAWSRRA